MWLAEISNIDYRARRAAFLKKIKGAVAVFVSAPEAFRNAEVSHPYRQDSNFYYLSGFEEPHSQLLLAPESPKPFQMFVRPSDPRRELWEGPVAGPDGALEHFGADAAHPSTPETYFDEAFINAMKNADRLYYRVGVDAAWDQKIFRLLNEARRRQSRTGRPLWPIHDPTDILGEMRLTKTRAELDRLQTAAQISAEAHISAMRMSKPGMYEYEVEAMLYHAFRVHGAARVGYDSIVASGPNACVLHYSRNRRRMLDQELLLVDAGAEFDYYTADVTRTFPVGGRFTPEQREVYAAVLRAQKECLALARPGKTLGEIHDRAVEVLIEELKALKVLKGTSEKIRRTRAYTTYFPHGTTHWLGMDVHDVGRYYNGSFDTGRKLRPGMVFTIEPGLYFPVGRGPERYRGIGVRIEDDVLITAQGAKVLTSACPKEIEQIESLCQN